MEKNDIFKTPLPENDKSHEFQSTLKTPLNHRKHKNFKDPLFMYKLLRIKMKISYQTCVLDVSLKELILSAIIKSHDEIEDMMASQYDDEREEQIENNQLLKVIKMERKETMNSGALE